MLVERNSKHKNMLCIVAVRVALLPSLVLSYKLNNAITKL